MQILVAVPYYETIRTECIKALYAMEVPGGISIDIQFISGYGPARARNLIACKCLGGGFDAVLYVDSDQIVPKNTLEKLLACGSHVAAGWSMMAVADSRTNIAQYNAEKNGYEFLGSSEVPVDEVIEVDAIGFACVLVKSSILKILSFPYFIYVEYADHTCLSEDLYFCGLVRKAGAVIKCNTSLKVGHIKTVVI